jgi:hypothetical protein
VQAPVTVAGGGPPTTCTATFPPLELNLPAILPGNRNGNSDFTVFIIRCIPPRAAGLPDLGSDGIVAP